MTDKIKEIIKEWNKVVGAPVVDLVEQAIKSEAAREYWEGQGWVRVGDGLPQKGERVFVCTDNWVCACCYINIHDEWKLAYDSSLFHGNITHWRPLPAPPNQ